MAAVLHDYEPRVLDHEDILAHLYDWSAVPWSRMPENLQTRVHLRLRQWAQMMHIPVVPTVKQMIVHMTPLNGLDRPLFWGGAMGGGKSSLLCQTAVRECREVPENRVFIGRQTRVAFTVSTFDTLSDMIDEGEWRHWPSASKFVHKWTASEIRYAGVGERADMQRHGSTQFGAVLIDEAPEIPASSFSMLQMRCRHPVAAQAERIKVVLAGNPALGWVREDFVESPKRGYVFLPAYMHDNPYLPPGYMDAAKAVLPSELLAAWVYGDWDAFTAPNVVMAPPLISAAKARWSYVDPDDSDCVWGIDVGHLGRDYTVVARRRGVVFDRVDKWLRKRTDQGVDAILALYAEADPRPRMMSIDMDGVGAGVWDGLMRAAERGIIRCQVNGVHAGDAPSRESKIQNPIRYANVKAELAFRMARLLEDQQGAIWPDWKEIVADLSAAHYETRQGKIYIESKEKVSGSLGRSPDDGDALLLTLHEGAQDEFDDDVLNEPGVSEDEYASVEDWGELDMDEVEALRAEQGYAARARALDSVRSRALRALRGGEGRNGPVSY